jgi:MFS superfamily sulfate permease-like transporter
MDNAPAVVRGEIPVGNVAGFLKYFRADFVSGFLVFLIALPLCLGISVNYGYPPVAGVFTAIIGGILTCFISNSETTIKGPAAGLIVVVAGCVAEYAGKEVIPGEVYQDAYRAALAVGVVAGVIQILFGVFKIGVLGDFFPTSVVHGMLAAIGVIIIAKQIPPLLGVKVGGDPIPLLIGIPKIAASANHDIAAVGLISLGIMFIWPLIAKRVKAIKAVPAAMVVLIVSIPLARMMQLDRTHTNKISLKENDDTKPAPAAANVGAISTAAKPTPTSAAPPKSDAFVNVPEFGHTFDALTRPNFNALSERPGWAARWVVMFALIGTLESMLTAKASDLIDPYRRKTSLDRDNLSIGIANTICSLIGATPMISEIVRTKANIDNGAQTRFANFWHGVLLLAFVTLLPFVIAMVPMAALMAMLIYTGFRLAHPHEFKHMYEIGPEQLLIFCSTLLGVIGIDLLWGVAIGILVKFVLHALNGCPIGSFFKPLLDVQQLNGNTYQIEAKRSAVFSNWIMLKKRIEAIRHDKKNLVIDLSDTRLVDHTVMARMHEMEAEFKQDGLELRVVGLEEHRPMSSHPLAARKRPA